MVRLTPKPAQELETVEECPACGASSFRHFATSGGLQIVRCKGCSLLVSSPRIPESQTRRFFEDDYLDDETLIEDNMTSFRQTSLRRTAARVKAHYPEGARLLDVGTASGLFLSQFSADPRWRAEGVEPSRKAASHAERRYGVTVHCGFLDTLAMPENALDVVAILDAFFLDPFPGRSLGIINRSLKPGGTVWLDIPGLRFRLLKNKGLIARLLYGNWAQLNPAMQMFYYEEKTLSKLMRRHGFELAGRHPEQSPLYGSAGMRFLNNAYFGATAALYRLTGGWLHLAPKELLIYRKVAP